MATNANTSKALLKVNRTYYVRTRKATTITLWLPNATESNGEPVEVKDADGEANTKNITIKTLKGQTIDGASTFTISASYGSAIFRSNGQQWYSAARNNVTDGGGDVVGPGSATDNALARFDTASGKLIQNSGVIVDDSNNMSGIGTLAHSGKQTNTTAATASITEASTPMLDLNSALAGSSVRKRIFPVRASITAGTTIMSWAIASGDAYTFRFKVRRKRTDSGGQSNTVDYEWHVEDIGGSVTPTARGAALGDRDYGGLAASAPVLAATKGVSPAILTIAPTAGTEVWSGFIEVEGPLNT